uniref:Sodefrin-like factor n=1 Tax=Romanomermis culicivorax TaxID=13658 RepID=A0A915I194_ROMCU
MRFEFVEKEIRSFRLDSDVLMQYNWKILFFLLSYVIYQTYGIKCIECNKGDVQDKEPDCNQGPPCEGAYCATSMVHVIFDLAGGKTNKTYQTTKMCMDDDAALESFGVAAGRCGKDDKTAQAYRLTSSLAGDTAGPKIASIRAALCVCNDKDMCNNGIHTSVDRVYAVSSTVGFIPITVRHELCGWSKALTS